MKNRYSFGYTDPREIYGVIYSRDTNSSLVTHLSENTESCEYCGTKHSDRQVVNCQNCGAPK